MFFQILVSLAISNIYFILRLANLTTKFSNESVEIEKKMLDEERIQSKYDMVAISKTYRKIFKTIILWVIINLLLLFVIVQEINLRFFYLSI